jgi:hypothetical protein
MWVLPEPDNSERATRCYNEVAGVVSEWHTSENRERSVELNNVSCTIRMWYQRRPVLTLAPILPFIVITAPMIELPSTRAPIANLQLSPLAIMEDAK